MNRILRLLRLFSVSRDQGFLVECRAIFSTIHYNILEPFPSVDQVLAVLPCPDAFNSSPSSFLHSDILPSVFFFLRRIAGADRIGKCIPAAAGPCATPQFLRPRLNLDYIVPDVRQWHRIWKQGVLEW